MSSRRQVQAKAFARESSPQREACDNHDKPLTYQAEKRLWTLWTTLRIAHRVHSLSHCNRGEHIEKSVTHVLGLKCHPCTRLHIPRPPGRPRADWRRTGNLRPSRPPRWRSGRRPGRVSTGHPACRAATRGPGPASVVGKPDHGIGPAVIRQDHWYCPVGNPPDTAVGIICRRGRARGGGGRR